MIRLKSAVIVEGKYDKIALENVIDATIIPTNGFAIFRDREKCALIRELARRDGIIVMTDSDSAGQVIRSYLKKICNGGKITQVYVPCFPGKERRKQAPGKEGLLGVEGMSPHTLLAALERSGVTAKCQPERVVRITKTDLFRMGLSGCPDSAVRREKLMRFLGLPQLTANAFLDIINTLYSAEDFEEKVILWQQEADKK